MKPPAAGDLRVAQMNMWNLFDTVNDPKTGDDDSTPTPEQYAIKLEKIAKAIVELGLPDVVSANEIENETVLNDLIARPELRNAGYKVLVQEHNNDERGIRVGVLYKGDRLDVVGVEAPNPTFSFPDGGRGQIDRSLLYARPPLVVDFKLRGAAQASRSLAARSPRRVARCRGSTWASGSMRAAQPVPAMRSSWPATSMRCMRTVRTRSWKSAPTAARACTMRRSDSARLIATRTSIVVRRTCWIT
jgi:hypothetical protein